MPKTKSNSDLDRLLGDSKLEMLIEIAEIIITFDKKKCISSSVMIGDIVKIIFKYYPGIRG